MKKLFMFLAVAGLATFGASCSSDDNSDEPVKVEAGQLAVKADKTEINAGESVKFSVTLDGKEEKGSELFIGDEQIYTPHKFEKAGEFEVVAKKKGAKDSAAVKITVKGESTGEPQPGEETLVLKGVTEAGEVKVGAKLAFSFTDAEGVNVDGAKLHKNGVEIAGTEYVVTEADAKTTLKFTAKKGELVSNEIVYTVKALPTKLTTNFFSYDGVQYEVDKALFSYLGSQDFQGTPIDLYTMILAKMNGDKIENRIMGNVAFKRIDGAVQILPMDGDIKIAAYGGFSFEGEGEDIATPVVTNETIITLSGMNLVDLDTGIKAASKGKVVFEFGLTGTNDKVSGLFEGQIVVFTEKQKTNSINATNFNGVKTVELSRKK
ncbi:MULTISPECIES: hypothetical protein [unclassified Myroides]|uniref:hypothetical protein n=1 Tax=unclassified Myroides TaxID=2642485 RepID=UPI0031014793